MRVVWLGPNPLVITKKVSFLPLQPYEMDARYWRSIHQRGLTARLKETGLVARQLARGFYKDEEVMHYARLAFGEDAANIESPSEAIALLMDHLSDSRSERVSFAPSLEPIETEAAHEASEPEEEDAPELEPSDVDLSDPDVKHLVPKWETPEERATIVAAMAAEGVPVSAIAEAVGISASTVRKDLKRAE